MKSRIYTFESEQIIVHWDYHRCIHVEACIQSLPAVFDRYRRPWIDPSQATADEVAAACERCPTGALHYERLDNGPAEALAEANRITVCSNGPLYARGNVHVQDPEGEDILSDTRVALCRCGHSKNKPLCDGSHEEAKFEAEGALTEAVLDRGDGGIPEQGELILQATEGGPLTIRGSSEMRGDQADTCMHVQVGALCCCGKSKNKPFCDGSHAEGQEE